MPLDNLLTLHRVPTNLEVVSGVKASLKAIAQTHAKDPDHLIPGTMAMVGYDRLCRYVMADLIRETLGSIDRQAADMIAHGLKRLAAMSEAAVQDDREDSPKSLADDVGKAVWEIAETLQNHFDMSGDE